MELKRAKELLPVLADGLDPLTGGGIVHVIWILDTKWKLLWEPQAQPEQADLYQLFAYQHKYRAVGVVLLCPQHPTAPCSPRDYTDDDGTQVLLRYFDLSHPQESLRALLGEWDN